MSSHVIPTQSGDTGIGARPAGFWFLECRPLGRRASHNWTMDWTKLLSTKRARELMGGKPSVRASNDERSEFERDYDRTVFSTPVRRLQDKAQVFPLEPCDAIRTRLTHSLEVSSLARDLTRQLFRALSTQGIIEPDSIDDFSTIAATSGLLHDLGNPPFGHAGEIAIREWFTTDRNRSVLKDFERSGVYNLNRYAQDFRKFDGNAQTVRLIT